jgi:hypothetical protein
VHRLISVNVVELWKVPPDAVESMIRQLVNQFVHDRARPEVPSSNSPFIQLVFLFLLQLKPKFYVLFSHLFLDSCLFMISISQCCAFG